MLHIFNILWLNEEPPYVFNGFTEFSDIDFIWG